MEPVLSKMSSLSELNAWDEDEEDLQIIQRQPGGDVAEETDAPQLLISATVFSSSMDMSIMDENDEEEEEESENVGKSVLTRFSYSRKVYRETVHCFSWFARKPGWCF